ncbi:MAG: orotidine-5'-phosphate decarboxylase [Bacteroidota bacterium]|nr:orotidine-5'-phosphate decarboxylase [Bacteroidota bacterium]
MNRSQLVAEIKHKKSFLCIGLDTDISKIPVHLKASADPVFEFNKAIIDATSEFCVAYKPNIAFYESNGPAGWESLRKTLEYIPENCFTVADAKRGDIGNTSAMYAKTFFEYYNFDAVTVAPYMGEDSVTPFLETKNKWVILLALTSNKGAVDFQMDQLAGGDRLFEKVIKESLLWGSNENLMYVVGATRGDLFRDVRILAPDHFLLVPGVGAQGGSLAEVCQYGMNKECGLLVNSSRSIIYASSGLDFADSARQEAAIIQQEMEQLLRAGHVV